MYSRRRLLTSTALAAAGLLGLGGGRAHAFRAEPLPATDLADMKAAQAQCRAAAAHDRQLAVLRAGLEQGPLTAEERQRVLASATCPLCGGALAG